MKLLIVTPYFYPENFKVNDMAFELQRRGHQVSVMTPIPNYPAGKFYKGYGLFKKRHEVVNGVEIHRSLVIPRHSGKGIWLALNYLSYTFFACLQSIRFGLKKKYDAIIVHEPSPVLVGIPAVWIKKMLRIPLHFWVLDLWPESLTAAGGITSGKILSVFDKLTKWIYRNCDTIMVGSRGFEQSICTKGDFKHKIVFFPNWVEEVLDKPVNIKVPDLPKGFNVVSAGNMGDAQDLPAVMEAARRLKGMNINFNFIGDGRKREYVENFARENGLTNSVFCYGRYPIEAMPSFFKQADVLFFALKDSPIFSLTVPSRLQAFMSSGKPVVAMINGEGASTIADADCGWSVPAGSPDALADLLRKISETADKELLSRKGENGKDYSRRHYDFSHCIDHLEDIIKPQ